MKLTYNIFGLILFTTFCSAQVGIGTTSPQQELDVSGVNSTIRFDKFNSVNSPIENDGVDLAPVYVNGKGDLSLGDGSGNGVGLPINFLIENFNFIPDDPYGIGENTGIVVNNNSIGVTYIAATMYSVEFTVPQESLIELKYGITMMVKGSDISIGPPYSDLTYDQAVSIGVLFCIDIDNDGLSAAERLIEYGHNGQYYATQYGGISGYSYINGQGYLTIPAGTHKVVFFGTVRDFWSSYTSVGYGGAMDYLKIRIFN